MPSWLAIGFEKYIYFSKLGRHRECRLDLFDFHLLRIAGQVGPVVGVHIHNFSAEAVEFVPIGGFLELLAGAGHGVNHTKKTCLELPVGDADFLIPGGQDRRSLFSRQLVFPGDSGKEWRNRPSVPTEPPRSE